MTTKVSLPVPFGKACADVLLARVREQGQRTSNRHIIDYLPGHVARILHDGLLELADVEIELTVISDDGSRTCERLAAIYIEALDADLIPIFMEGRHTLAGPQDHRGSLNIATEGFASYLRDHYVDDAQRSRFLVTIASEGNETQKSAQDLLADHTLLSLEMLLHNVLRQAAVSSDSQLHETARVYHVYHADDPEWAEVVRCFETYIDEVAHAPASVQGAKLPMLGCFLPDSSEQFATGERVTFLEGQDQRRRERGQGRLFDNALLREFFTERLEDPLVDLRAALREDFAERPEQADALIEKRHAGLDDLEMRVFEDLAQRASKRKKPEFEISSLEVFEARAWRRLGGQQDTNLVITADTAFTIRVSITGQLTKPRTAQIVRWNRDKKKLDAQAVPADGNQLCFEIPAPTANFTVFRLALASGPRALSKPYDWIDVALYKGSVEHVLVEARRRLSIGEHAWVIDGEPTFEIYEVNDIRPVDAIIEAMGEDDDDEESAREWRFSETPLRTQTITPEDTEDDSSGEHEVQALLELVTDARRRKRGDERMLKAFRERKHDRDQYLDAVLNISAVPPTWEVDLGESGRYKVFPASRMAGRFIYEQAVERLLNSPDTMRMTLSAGSRDLVPIAWDPSLEEALRQFLSVRTKLFSDIIVEARKRIAALRGGAETGVPLFLLPMHRLSQTIADYLCAWQDAVALSLERKPYGTLHDALLQLDTLRIMDAHVRIERVVVLPTHPWLLNALLRFQTLMSQNFEAKDPPLEPDDIDDMVPRAVIEDWHVLDAGTQHLRLVESAPFHLEFSASIPGDRGESLSYIARIISAKLRRYLDMHPYLREERRTLRVGFINPGDAKYFLEGLQMWLRSEMPASVRSLDQARIPAIDVLLFTSERSDEDGSAFEQFFNEQVGAADEDVIRQTLLARLRYRRCDGAGPALPLQSVHICFARGLVDDKSHAIKTGSLADGWDGAFGDGLLATYVRKTIPGVAGRLQSRRGLWVASESEGLRGALAGILTLQRACRDSDVDADKALFWECTLPDLASMRGTYDHSDWVVHLDRELSLELFKGGSGRDNLPTIIEYSDQEVPQSPGFDTITATKHARPYEEQLGEILKIVNLDMSGRKEDAQTSARGILRDINALSGSWALDFLVGNLADNRHRTRLQGNIGAALVYRWLRRIEGAKDGGSVIDTGTEPMLPVYISLEGLIRATPAAGLKREDGLIARFSNDFEEKENKNARRWCDDILVMYLPKSEPGTPSRLFGRIIEVKLGTSVLGAAGKAVEQVRATNNLLTKTLSGGNETVDAPFRHKLLSMLLKAQLEQAVAIGAMDADIYDFLDVPSLSTNLATGNYSVDYMIGVDNQTLAGDVFLLHPDPDEQEDEAVSTRIEDGVRIITLGYKLVEWLAFQPELGPTFVNPPPSTRPRLGRYRNLRTNPGVAPAGTEVIRPPEPAAQVVLVREADQVTLATLDASSPGDMRNEPSGEIDVPALSPHLVANPTPAVSLDAACAIPVKQAPYPDQIIVDVTQRLERALRGHKVRVAGPPSPREVDRGPRLLRAYVRLEAGESINSLRRSSEDIARVVGTESSDIHISNIPERHAVALDLPIVGLSYAVDFAELRAHPSFRAAARELELGFCAGIDVTGRAVWTDLASMPHMLVAGTTGSGKTIFLRSLILTLLLNRTPKQLHICLSSSKPMDFKIFTRSPHSQGRDMAVEPHEALALAEELVEEMNRRIDVITDAVCDNLAEYNQENPGSAMPYVVAVFDEYSAMMISFSDKDQRSRFEGAIGHLAQKARAAGIHLIICMQRPDAAILKGAIKANILHRFALKLPQNQDSRVILDDGGAETLLGKGDMLYKDSSGRIARLQVPFLDNRELKQLLPGL